MTALNKTISKYKQENEIKGKTETETSLGQQTHEYETLGVVFYFLSVQFSSVHLTKS